MAQRFHDELSALRSMFPSWDMEVLEELLESYRGDVSRTVDSLLTMDELHSASDAQHPQPPPASVSSSPDLNLRSRVNLPDDFLRLPISGTGGLSEQEKRDAVLARMLQDQLFRDEILSSEEFASHFNDDRTTEQRQAYPPEKTAAEIASETYAFMSEKITTMSEVMKSKAHDMYIRYLVRNEALASSDPKSNRPLMEGDSDSSEDESLNSNPDVRHSQCHNQGSRARWNLHSPKSDAFSKKSN